MKSGAKDASPPQPNNNAYMATAQHLASRVQQAQTMAAGGTGTQPLQSRMPGGRPAVAIVESSDSEEDEDHLLEESPCGRYGKRKQQVRQRDVPGIDVAYLAMDNETGNEVVWNEVQFSESKKFRAQEESIKAIFNNLQQLQHPNLVTFHKYWIDSKSEKPRVVFITEYMASGIKSSGSMQKFLRMTYNGNRTMGEKVWKRWCTQILSALVYLHSCEPAIVHGNLNCNTIFIQINRLIKIGCVAPNTIHHHVKTVRDAVKNMHYFAPEYEQGGAAVTPAADIYAFGVCALEMILLGFSSQPQTSSGGPVALVTSAEQKKHSVPTAGVAKPTTTADDSGVLTATTSSTSSAAHKTGQLHGAATVPAHLDNPPVAPTHVVSAPPLLVSQETIQKGLDRLENPLMRDFIRSCLESNPADRPTARQLLFHSVLFEVPSLQLMAAHCMIDKGLHESLESDHNSNSTRDVNTVVAETRRRTFTVGDVPLFEADKLLEDVKNGIYPLTVFAQPHRAPQQILPDLQSSASGHSTNHSGDMPSSNHIKRPPDSDELTLMHRAESEYRNETQGEMGMRDGERLVNGGDNSTSHATMTGSMHKEHGEGDAGTSSTANSYPVEKRRLRKMTTELKMLDGNMCHMTLTFKLQDGMNRQLSADICIDDESTELTKELVKYGFINLDDSRSVQDLVQEALTNCRSQRVSPVTPTLADPGGQLPDALRVERSSSQASVPVVTTNGNTSSSKSTPSHRRPHIR